jgi:hypothetical protein
MGGFMALDRKYAIPKIMHHKSAGSVKMSLAHSLREKLMPEAKERIDPARSHLNTYGIAGGKVLTVESRMAFLDKRLKPYQTREEGYRKLQTGTKDGKHDSVICTEYVITMSPEIANKMTHAQKSEYFKKCRFLLSDQYGKDNLVQFAIHRDEETEHMHVWCFPEVVEKKVYKLTSRERAKQKKDPKIVARVAEIHSLSSSSFLGSKEKMRTMWDKVAEIGGEFGMIRGRRGSHLEKQSHKKFHEEMKKIEEEVLEMFEPRGQGLSKESPKKILERLRPVILDLYRENLSLQTYAKEHEKEAEKSNHPSMRKMISDYYKLYAGLSADEKREVDALIRERVEAKKVLTAAKDKAYQEEYRKTHKPVKSVERPL